MAESKAAETGVKPSGGAASLALRPSLRFVKETFDSFELDHSHLAVAFHVCWVKYLEELGFEFDLPSAWTVPNPATERFQNLSFQREKEAFKASALFVGGATYMVYIKVEGSSAPPYRMTVPQANYEATALKIFNCLLGFRSAFLIPHYSDKMVSFQVGALSLLRFHFTPSLPQQSVAPALSFLPNDVFRRLASFLPVQAHCALAQTSKHFQSRCSDNEVWKELYTRDFHRAGATAPDGSHLSSDSWKQRYIAHYRSQQRSQHQALHPSHLYFPHEDFSALYPPVPPGPFGFWPGPLVPPPPGPPRPPWHFGRPPPNLWLPFGQREPSPTFPWDEY